MQAEGTEVWQEPAGVFEASAAGADEQGDSQARTWGDLGLQASEAEIQQRLMSRKDT